MGRHFLRSYVQLLIYTCHKRGVHAMGGINEGKFSWCRLSGFTRNSSPIGLAVTGYITNLGLTTFPTIQRRGYGLRDSGSLRKDLGI